MFIHIFTYRFKCLLRDRTMIFWTLLFPIILATLFSMAFSQLNTGEEFSPINIAVVNNDFYQQNEDFKQVLNSVSEGDNKIFNLTQASTDEAEKLLSNGAIKAYIILEPNIKLIVRDSGISQTIVKTFLEEYKQTTNSISNIASNNRENIEKVITDVNNRLSFTKSVSTTAEPNNVFNYYYALLAMACFYGSFWGLREIVDIQANLSSLAARINMLPVHKLKAFISSMSASILIQFIVILILLSYMHFVIGIDFGSKSAYILLTTIVSTITGVTFGAFISSLISNKQNIKNGILIVISMTGSFLAGMMYDKMKIIVQENIPILSYINPINLISDSFYSLYYYDTFDRYWLNIKLLLLFILLFSFGTYLVLRRRKYASI